MAKPASSTVSSNFSVRENHMLTVSKVRCVTILSRDFRPTSVGLHQARLRCRLLDQRCPDVLGVDPRLYP